MFFLLRVAFWCTVVLVLLPSGSSQPGTQDAKIGATEAIVAASAAVSDVSGFCERQPDACAVGAQAAVVLGQRAQAGARMVYDFINRQWTRPETTMVAEHKLEPSLDTVGTIPTILASQNTLTAADLEPAWQGPPALAETVPLPRPRPNSRRKA